MTAIAGPESADATFEGPGVFKRKVQTCECPNLGAATIRWWLMSHVLSPRLLL